MAGTKSVNCFPCLFCTEICRYKFYIGENGKLIKLTRKGVNDGGNSTLGQDGLTVDFLVNDLLKVSNCKWNEQIDLETGYRPNEAQLLPICDSCERIIQRCYKTHVQINELANRLENWRQELIGQVFKSFPSPNPKDLIENPFWKSVRDEATSSFKLNFDVQGQVNNDSPMTAENGGTSLVKPVSSAVAGSLVMTCSSRLNSEIQNVLEPRNPSVEAESTDDDDEVVVLPAPVKKTPQLITILDDSDDCDKVKGQPIPAKRKLEMSELTGKRFTTLFMNSAKDKYFIKCPECSAFFEHSGRYRAHAYSHKAKRRHFNCDLCGWWLNEDKIVSHNKCAHIPLSRTNSACHPQSNSPNGPTVSSVQRTYGPLEHLNLDNKPFEIRKCVPSDLENFNQSAVQTYANKIIYKCKLCPCFYLSEARFSSSAHAQLHLDINEVQITCTKCRWVIKLQDFQDHYDEFHKICSDSDPEMLCA